MWSFVLLVFINIICGIVAELPKYPDYKDHPCDRQCTDDGEPMTCVYNFTLEYYYTLTKACYDCPRNLKDCYRPHCIPADGVSRPVAVVNRQLPGPGIFVCQNDMILVNVKNNLETHEGTTIHWHGVLQNESPWMDGVPMVTQCPIPSRTTFQYRFKAQNAGTHYWHSHSGFQRADGIFGHLVIRQPSKIEPQIQLYDHDLSEHTVMVNDWLNQLIIDRFAAHQHSDGDHYPKLVLINGRHSYKNFTYDDAPGEIFNTPNEVFRVKSNERYRFRVVSNAIFNCPLQISIDYHNLIMIASDGVPFDPVVVDSFNIFGGERYDFVLNASRTVDSYWFRVRRIPDCGDSQRQPQAVAILRYETAFEEKPTESQDYLSAKQDEIILNENENGNDTRIPVNVLDSLVPDDKALQEIPDKKFYLTFDINKMHNNHYHNPEPVLGHHLVSTQINHISNTLPPSPPLTQYTDVPEDMYCNADSIKKNCSEELCQCVHRLQVNIDDTVELVLIDEGVTSDSNHHMHLHGHAFRVVAINKFNTSTSLAEVKALDEAGMIKRKLSKVVSKDTVTVPDSGYTVIRFHADNPGVWFFHCHIEFHMEFGMGLLIQVGSKEEMPNKPKGFPKCGNWHYTEMEDGLMMDDGNEQPPPKNCPTSSSHKLSINYISLLLAVFLWSFVMCKIW